ncbi:MAG: hypothetical protein M1835_004148 [Candelina submexicana]|nr:MAG: hypothetical protein M1835_004148 [Candelina submexicana]
MSDAYERERYSPNNTPFLKPLSLTHSPFPRQNNGRLDELASKVSALRGVTVDIYDNARSQDVIDSSVCDHSLFLSPFAADGPQSSPPVLTKDE